MLAGVKFVPRDQIHKVRSIFYLDLVFCLCWKSLIRCSTNLWFHFISFYYLFANVTMFWVSCHRMRVRILHQNRERNQVARRNNIGGRRKVPSIVAQMKTLEK